MKVNIMNVESVILQRCKLQSTQKVLDELGVVILPLKNNKLYFKTPANFTPEDKKRLIITLGGRVNYRETEKLLQNI